MSLANCTIADTVSRERRSARHKPPTNMTSPCSSLMSLCLSLPRTPGQTTLRAPVSCKAAEQGPSTIGAVGTHSNFLADLVVRSNRLTCPRTPRSTKLSHTSISNNGCARKASAHSVDEKFQRVHRNQSPNPRRVCSWLADLVNLPRS